MLTIVGSEGDSCAFCDGLPRRDFLKIGGLVMGGLSLTDILRAEEQAGIRHSHKAIIITNPLGEFPTERSVHVQEVFATLYRCLGIPEDISVPDAAGRQYRLVDGHAPIRELI
jgi:hypothetical protein